MGRNKKHRKRDGEDYLRYTGNEMTGRERNIFEKELQKDTFDSEAINGLSSISPDEARSDLSDLHQRLSGRIQQKNRFIFPRVAAAVATILVLGSLIIMITRIGLFPGQIAKTETREQKSEETIADEEMLIQPGSEIPMSEEENSRSDMKTDRQVKEQPLTESRDQFSLSEKPEEDVSFKMKEQMDEQEIPAITEQHELEITDESQGIVMEDKNIELVQMDETGEMLFTEEAAPPSSPKKARSAGKGNMFARIVSPTLVRGVVISSEDDLPIPGAIVSVKGTSSETVTGYDGSFELTLHDDTSQTLIADFIGMERKEIKMKDEEDVRITLDPSASALDEVVVIGSGIQKQEDVTGAVTTIQTTDHTGYQPVRPVTGYPAFIEYIKSNLKFPPGDTIHSKAVVVLRFNVGKNGRAENIFVIKSPGKEFSDEAIRLLKTGPDWMVPESDGLTIGEEIMIRILFRPEY